MTTPILIPSRGRAHMFARDFCTIKQMDDETHKNVYYFVPREEQAAYFLRAPKNVNIVPVGPYPETISLKRKLMANWAQEFGFKRFFMFDDDLRWSVRKISDAAGLRLSDCYDISRMLNRMETMMLTKGYAVVGVSMRQGNNTIGMGDEKNLYEENVRICRAGLFDTEKFLSVKHDRLRFLGDFDVLLQLLEAGHKIASTFYWAQDQPQTQHPGGCTIFRNHETHLEAVKGLQALHPDVVSLVEKTNKTGGEFGKRTEVRIQWKKAYKPPV